MKLRILLLATFFTLLSVVILGYLSIATVFGPWIAPTLVLFLLALPTAFWGASLEKKEQTIALVQSVASVGGIVAVAIGFALPMLFFLDREAFVAVASSGWLFLAGSALVCVVAGGFGIYLGNLFSPMFIDEKKLQFPVSQMTCQMIQAEQSEKTINRLGRGFVAAFIFCALRDVAGILCFQITNIVGTATISLFSPMFVALGYTTGISIALPLIVGLLSKFFILPPLYKTLLLVVQPMSFTAFLTAFCSGLVLSEFFVGMVKNAQKFIKKSRNETDGLKHLCGAFVKKTCLISAADKDIAGLLLYTFLSCFILYLAGFTATEQIMMLGLTVLATYYINIIGGNVGFIQLGRFSTYVLIPMILLFRLNALQMTLICVFFNICAATSSDLLFDYKTAETMHIERQTMWRLQWLGLFLTAAVVGLVFWLFFTYLPLGSETFVAQRSQSRALMINTFSFNSWIVLSGICYGLLLILLRLSPTMIFSGLFIPPLQVVALVAGGLLSYVWKHTSPTLAFCAGVFSAESIWILVSILLKASGVL